MKRLMVALLFLIAAPPAWPRVAVVFLRLASAPMLVQAGQEFSLCATNVGTADADIVLNFVSVRTGYHRCEQEVILPPPGVGGAMPDLLLSTTADAIAKAGNDAPSGYRADGSSPDGGQARRLP